jgi:hypothetical protein
MTVVEAPAEFQPASEPALFLAGGITGCPGWQAEMIALLDGLPMTVLNPRRANFPIDDPSAAEGQIRWEFRHLRKTDAVLFWFPAETLCPISLYELGTWTAYRDERGQRPLFVGTHPGYQRRQDVVIQTRLARPEVTVRERLEDLAGDVREWLRSAGTACPTPAG